MIERLCLIALLAFAVSGCGEDSGQESDAADHRNRYPHSKELETGNDGLVRLKGEGQPFTGVVIHGDGERAIRYFASYEEGKPHGPQIRYHENGRIRKIEDYHHGEKVHHREWYENGNQELDALMKDGIAYGRHLKWFEDGSLRFSARLMENLRWDGPVFDMSESGELMWDAEFENGRYVRGHYPPEAQANLLERGLLEPKDARYPIEDGGSDSPGKAPKQAE